MLTKQLGVCGMAIVLAAGSTLTAASPAPLADSVEKKDRTATIGLLKQDAQVNAAQVDGMTALHWAAYQDDLDTTKLLLEAGANVKATNRYHVTPLSLACLNGNGKMVELFLEAGADANATLDGGEPVLMTAARTGKVAAVKALLSHGAKVNAKGRKQQTALMWAAAEGNTEVVQLLLKAGADFRTPLDSGFTPLLFAVREGKAGCVQPLLNAGLDVNEPVHAAKKGELGNGITPLVLAVENGHFDLARDLLEAGADPNDQRSGYTALHIMTWVRKPDGGDNKAGNPSPIGSGQLSDFEFVRKLVEYGADVNAKLHKGNTLRKGATPFFMASTTADAPYMRLLLELGADPLLTNSENSTPLMVATGIETKLENLSAGTEVEILEVAQLLLDLGVDIDAVDNNGETAMHGAAYKNLPKVVQFLDDKHANIEVWNQRNKKGLTPFLIAAGHRPGNFKPSVETMAAIRQVMLAHGLTPTAKAPRHKDLYSNKSPFVKVKSDKKKPPTKKAKQGKVVKLFNGKNLDGWTIQNKGKFSVKDGKIKINRGTGWLRSVETYADFRLVMEFRFLEPEANSGIFVRTRPTSKKTKEGWPDNGYQVQCKDTLVGKPLASLLPYGAPPFEHKFDLAALKKAYKPAGEWHTYEITAKGETLEVKLNGILITTATSIKHLDGHIGIQGENGLLEFRKIEVTRL